MVVAIRGFRFQVLDVRMPARLGCMRPFVGQYSTVFAEFRSHVLQDAVLL